MSAKRSANTIFLMSPLRINAIASWTWGASGFFQLRYCGKKTSARTIGPATNSGKKTTKMA